MKEVITYLLGIGLLLFLNINIGTCQINEIYSAIDHNQDTSSKAHWFSYIDFDIRNFKNPPSKFGPMVRWWWPGNNVSQKELIRELRLLKRNGFSGVEIQPFSEGISSRTSKNILNKWYSWDTESYYDNLRSVMKEARRLGMIVDMTAGSGWPLSTPKTSPSNGMELLTYADTIVRGGKRISIPLPKKIHRLKGAFRTLKKLDFSLAKLQEVVAGRIIGKDSSRFKLDSRSIRIITNSVLGDKLKWKVPARGKWCVIAIYSIPTMGVNQNAAKGYPLYVVNHFDSTDIQNAYNYLFGTRTGLEKFYGDPFRAVFNDSYEFKSDVFWPGQNFFSEFRKERGYDMKPWLPQIMIGNSNDLGFLARSYKSKFIISKKEGKRLKYDYYHTTGNMLVKQLIEGSNHWLESRGLLHRTQPYGPRGLNTIKGAGHSDIPETEQLFGGGSEGFVKLVTSGAHLYNRPIVTQESFVFLLRPFMTTPQKLKALSNKSFAEGVNQIIYHGFPYKLKTTDYGMIGWSPFISPRSSLIFSSHINEANPFWEDIKRVNDYIRRSQYAMRSGKPQADVLIYAPGITVNVGPNPEETLVGGWLKEVEPEIGIIMPKPKKKDRWFWKVVNKLESLGITWDYVNEESLKTADFKDGRINIRGNEYKAVILPQIPFASIPSAKSINALARKGANILVVGELPSRQPGFLDYRKRDKKVYNLIKESVHQFHGYHLKSPDLIDHWIERIPKNIRFDDNLNFVRQAMRRLGDGSKIYYYWNKEGTWEKLFLKRSNKIKRKNFYWLNPGSGAIYQAEDSDKISYTIPPYSSVILYVTNRSVPVTLLSNYNPTPSGVLHSKEIIQIKKWNISIGDGQKYFVKDSLFDWKSRKDLKFESTEGIYTSSFDLKKQQGKSYYLDLGTVYFTAEVYINGEYAGKRIWAPFTLDITELIHSGENKIKVKVTPALINKLVGLGREAEEGAPYFQFKGKEALILPAGLIGPVTIKKM